MKKVIALISVRTSSKRLPNKALLKYKNLNILDRIILNLKRSKFINKIIVATTQNKNDRKIFNHCKKKKYECFRGDEFNILKRFYDASKKYKPKLIVRVTGDNPFTSHELTDYMIKKHLKNNVDFTYMDKKNLPAGICPEIISFKAIEKILNYKINFKYSEYMIFYFTNNRKIFKINKLSPPKELKFPKRGLRLTLDYKKDLILIKKIIDLLKLKNKASNLKDLYKVVLQSPSIMNINKKFVPVWKKNKKLIKLIKDQSHIKIFRV